jgi:hypothetical protein
MTLNEKFDLELQESNFPHTGNVEEGLNSQEQLQMLEHMNSVLSPLTTTATLNPYYMVQRIKDRVKLALGLTFDETLFLGESGTRTCFLFPTENVHAQSKAGIHFPDHPYLKMFPSGLIIKFQFLKIATTYHVDVKIVPAIKSVIPMSED